MWLQVNKLLLLNNQSFIPYLIDALMLDPNHPRASLDERLKIWVQSSHAECLAQLAVFPAGREELSARGDAVFGPLQAVVDGGALSQEARDFCVAALVALSDTADRTKTAHQPDTLHVMLSYQWSVQPTVQRINEALLNRGFLTWFDLTNMKGSTMDAMRYASALALLSLRSLFPSAYMTDRMDCWPSSDAVEGAAVMLYGVCLACEHLKQQLLLLLATCYLLLATCCCLLPTTDLLPAYSLRCLLHCFLTR